MKEITIYEAFDSTQFETREGCIAYEKKHGLGRLAGLTIEQLENAIRGANAELASLLEEIGTKIARDRRERGILKRAPNKKPADEPPATTEGAPE